MRGGDQRQEAPHQGGGRGGEGAVLPEHPHGDLRDECKWGERFRCPEYNTPQEERFDVDLSSRSQNDVSYLE